jgi:hypothetical protein
MQSGDHLHRLPRNRPIAPGEASIAPDGHKKGVKTAPNLNPSWRPVVKMILIYTRAVRMDFLLRAVPAPRCRVMRGAFFLQMDNYDA